MGWFPATARALDVLGDLLALAAGPAAAQSTVSFASGAAIRYSTAGIDLEPLTSIVIGARSGLSSAYRAGSVRPRARARQVLHRTVSFGAVPSTLAGDAWSRLGRT